MVNIKGFQTLKEYEFLQKRLGDLISDEKFLFVEFLKENNIDFIISGSASLYINGLLDRKIKDLDLNMDEENFKKLKNLKRKNDYVEESKDYDMEIQQFYFDSSFNLKNKKIKNNNPFPKMCKVFYKYYFSFPIQKKYPWENDYNSIKYDIFVCEKNMEDYHEVNGLKVMTGWGMIKIKTMINICYQKIRKHDGFHYKTKMKHLQDTFKIFGKSNNPNSTLFHSSNTL